MDPVDFTAELKQEALRIGFSLVGVCPAIEPASLHHLEHWLDAGYAGKMRYLPERRGAYRHPRNVLEGVRSLVMLATNYRTAEPRPAAAGQGRVARYAWGSVDYHDLIRERLKQLCDWMSTRDSTIRARGVVDTAPLLERAFGQLAGLGWIGKNTMLINRELGSWFFLAALLVDRELAYDAPYPANHCGTCTACLDACPTQALIQPHLLDATRCISYLTIEHHSAIPAHHHTGMGAWIFGCDICQEVCPWNRSTQVSTESSFAPRSDMDPVDLIDCFGLDADAFRQRYRHTPLWRSQRRCLLRNAAIILGNQRDSKAIPILMRGKADADEIVRGACMWALNQILGSVE